MQKVLAAVRRYYASPPPEVSFGRFHVRRSVTVFAGGRDRDLLLGQTRFEVADPATGAVVVSELDAAGQPMPTQLRSGIDGRVDGQAFLVRRPSGPRLLRRQRVVLVTGAVELHLAWDGAEGRSKIRVGVHGDGPVLWSSAARDEPAPDIRHREAAVAFALLSNGVEHASSLLRYVAFVVRTRLGGR